MRYRKRRYSRKISPGDMVLQMKRIRTIRSDAKENEFIALAFKPTDFQEFNDLNDNFEAFQFLSYSVKVMPTMNVSNNSTSKISTYCIAPWKKEAKTPATYSNLLSIDRSKVYRGTQTAYRRFVPAVHLSAENAVAAGSYGTIKWRPRIDNVEGAGSILHWCGIIGIQGNPEATENTNYYNVVESVTVRLINQNILGKAAVHSDSQRLSEAFEVM